eukprot:MONOS_4168.1-p1 / transcript=MONOS_4168.1 / gene=MONOS_4168 / organism=Monocercomonoides_exilis_PA203 / gene_product=unspecified product / transcript_product=unspecified product / location=Mono_scaffold00107:25946-27897(+) / protein_length=600 / sequence_SO=supercontig / SO=protein_coding / is_pseudo=false
MNDEMNVEEEINYLKREIREKEVGEIEPQMRKLYHLLKLLKSGLYGLFNDLQDAKMIEKLIDNCGNFQSPREVLTARVLGGISRILCLSYDFDEEEYEMDMGNLSEPAKRLAKSIPLFSGEERYKTIDDELVALGECDDEDICLNTIAYYRYLSIDNGCTPVIGEYSCALIGKWLYSLLSHSIHSVIIETLKTVKKLSSLKVYLKLGKTVKTNNVLTLDSFIPNPNASNTKQASVGSSKFNSSDWVPPVYSHGAICSVALKAFHCLCRLSAKHVSAFAHILTCQDRIVEKVFFYLFGSWTEEEWKAIFPGSRFLEESCCDIYSSGGANFQHMIDGQYCEELSVRKMISKFQMCAIMFIRCWFVRQSYEAVNRCMKRDVMRRIASLLCYSDSDKMKLEAAKALLNGWACLSSNAHMRKLTVKKRIVFLEYSECLSHPLRKELIAKLAEACEEEGVIDMLNAHLTPNLSADVVKAKKDERIKRRLNAKCDPSICPVCAMFVDADINYNEIGREDEKEREKKVIYLKTQFQDLLDSKVKGKEYFELLNKCINAGDMSSNEYSQLEYQYDWVSSFIDDKTNDQCCEDSESEEDDGYETKYYIF